MEAFSSARFNLVGTHRHRAQAGIYLTLSLFLFILLAASFAAWSASMSSLSAKNKETFILSLEGKRAASALEIVERNGVGLEIETSSNTTFSDSLTVCGRGSCIRMESLPPEHFKILKLPHGLRIEK